MAGDCIAKSLRDWSETRTVDRSGSDFVLYRWTRDNRSNGTGDAFCSIRAWRRWAIGSSVTKRGTE